MLQKINIVPRWLIFSIDLAICLFAYLFLYLLYRQFSLSAISFVEFLGEAFIFILVNALVFYQFKTYAGIIRYTGEQDALRIFNAVAVSGIILSLLNFFSFQMGFLEVKASYLQLSLNALFSFTFLMAYRLLIKFVFAYSRNYKLDRKQVIIYGAGEAGFATRRVLAHDAKANVSILAFLDDNPKKAGKVVDGVPIYHSSALAKLTKENEVDELVIAIFTLPISKRNALIDQCLDLGIKVLSVPPMSKWMNGEFSTRQLQSIKIESLLERDPIQINNELLNTQLARKTVLVTGAAGSIGSEIVRQLLKYEPAQIILCDQAETPLHQLELDLAEMKHQVACIPCLADVRNQARMEEIFQTHQPQYVYHAAAYKHVPMMELCPSEAILTNVWGSQIVADLSVKYGVERFVMISTDKAVNPTNVMGASKRLAETYIQHLHHRQKKTKFITTRFGNVLGSNGSVLHRFKEQIEKGGPLTVTHPQITRFFMTIPEACQLVLEAGSMGDGGEIFVFDMGEPVTIIELAKKMIRLYGLIPEVDIKIEFTGLRPGEKLFEELLNDAENTLPTYHDKILIASVRNQQINQINKHFEQLFAMAQAANANMQLVAKMKELVPEFLSNNSVFEELDQETDRTKIIDFKRVS
jgi:FlaA1/EpsC-like NDP-sugar epimerase